MHSDYALRMGVFCFLVYTAGQYSLRGFLHSDGVVRIWEINVLMDLLVQIY